MSAEELFEKTLASLLEENDGGRTIPVLLAGIQLMRTAIMCEQADGSANPVASADAIAERFIVAVVKKHAPPAISERFGRPLQ